MDRNDKWALPLFLGVGALVGRLFRNTMFGAIGGLIGYLIWKNAPEKNANIKEQPPMQ